MEKVTKEELYKAIRKLKQGKIIDGEVVMVLNQKVFDRFRKEIIKELPLGVRKLEDDDEQNAGIAQ